MTDPEQPSKQWRAGDPLDFASLRRNVDDALTALPPPSGDDILFTFRDPEPTPTPKLIDMLLADLAGLLVPCQDAVRSWEPEPKAMVTTMITEAYALIERRPVAPKVDQAYDYLQKLAHATRALAVVAYSGRSPEVPARDAPLPHPHTPTDGEARHT
ncbi:MULTISPECIES: hypothetical protein [Streptomyces]|uniref:Uncharacterized protein n=2 Tax=Streptomyces TaxID=1883 RepID=A0A0W7WW69_9ACTN|nr:MULTISPECIES: hypothetical protein [Streptomyces]KUF14830.1 hypothetical protein AT728_35690 [Streptomyces silvensis]MVO84552.1 hypothetical protein [Streptomyces typhae]